MRRERVTRTVASEDGTRQEPRERTTVTVDGERTVEPLERTVSDADHDDAAAGEDTEAGHE